MFGKKELPVPPERVADWRDPKHKQLLASPEAALQLAHQQIERLRSSRDDWEKRFNEVNSRITFYKNKAMEDERKEMEKTRSRYTQGLSELIEEMEKAKQLIWKFRSRFLKHLHPDFEEMLQELEGIFGYSTIAKAHVTEQEMKDAWRKMEERKS